MSKNQKYKNKFQNYFVQVAPILQKNTVFSYKIETVNNLLFL